MDQARACRLAREPPGVVKVTRPACVRGISLTIGSDIFDPGMNACTNAALVRRVSITSEAVFAAYLWSSDLRMQPAYTDDLVDLNGIVPGQSECPSATASIFLSACQFATCAAGDALFAPDVLPPDGDWSIVAARYRRSRRTRASPGSHSRRKPERRSGCRRGSCPGSGLRPAGRDQPAARYSRDAAARSGRARQRLNARSGFAATGVAPLAAHVAGVELFPCQLRRTSPCTHVFRKFRPTRSTTAFAI